MKSPLLVLVLAGALTLELHAQPGWSGAGLPFRMEYMYDIYNDTIGDALFFAGESSIDNDNGFDDQGVAVYRYGQWDTLGVFNGTVRSVIRHHDTLIAAGTFIDINGDPISKIAYFDSTSSSWQPFGSFDGNIFKLRIVDDTLFALGSFSFADGNACNGLARLMSGQWSNVGVWNVASQSILQDVIKFQGQLIACGGISFGTGSGDVVYFNGTEWLVLGPGLVGTWATGRAMEVYLGELYIGGAIDVDDGNAGHGIMRWDGTQFHPVGTGVFGNCNDYTCPSGVIDMEVHNDLLFCSGAIAFAGHAPATAKIATWDGQQWCGLPGDLRGPVDNIEFFHDTLFAGPFHEAEGVDVWCGARFIGTTYADTCSLNISTTDDQGLPEAIMLFPNPVGGTMTLDLTIAEGELLIHDVSGKQVLSHPVVHGRNTIDMRPLPSGLYFAAVHSNGAVSSRGKFTRVR